mgnify:CR=1 FL=1
MAANHMFSFAFILLVLVVVAAVVAVVLVLALRRRPPARGFPVEPLNVSQQQDRQ